MAKKKFNRQEALYAGFEKRSDARQVALMKATMNFVAYFMGLGDSKEDAEAKVQEMSREVKADLYPYVLGDTQPLIDAINASALPHMDAAAKAQLIGDLTI